MYPRTNKQNQKKKRKVDPPTHQVTLLFTLSMLKCFAPTHTEQQARNQDHVLKDDVWTGS